MTCGSCNALIPDGAKFCGICGATQAAEPAPAFQEASVPVPAYQEQPVYAAAPVYQQQPAYQAPPAYQVPPAQQPVYQAQPAPAPAEQPPPKGSRYAPISVLGYLGYFIAFAIPVLGIILAFVWAKDKKGNANRQNLAKLMAVMLVLALLVVLTAGIGGAVMASRIKKDPSLAGENGLFSLIPGLASGGGSGTGGSGFPFNFGGGGSGGDGGNGGSGGDGGDGGGSALPFGGSGGDGGGGIEDPAQAYSQLAQMFGAGWPENEFTKQVPKPKFETSVGIIEDYSCIMMTGATVDQLKDYVKELKKAGFDKNDNTEDQNILGIQVYSYSASNGKGYRVEIGYAGYAMGMSAITISREGIS